MDLKRTAIIIIVMYRTFSPPDDLTDRHGMKSRLV